MRTPHLRAQAIRAIQAIPANEVYECDLKPWKHNRTLEQSAKFHAMCGDVAKQALFMGKKLALEQWKVLFVSGHAVATKEGAEVVPGLEGEFVNIRESTAQMKTHRMASLIEYTQAWGDQNNIQWTDTTYSDPIYSQAWSERGRP